MTVKEIVNAFKNDYGITLGSDNKPNREQSSRAFINEITYRLQLGFSVKSEKIEYSRICYTSNSQIEALDAA